MKRTFTLIALLCGTILNVSAQKKVFFNMKYLPNTNYTVSTNMDMKMEMDFQGDTAQIKSMKASGMQVPMVMLMNMDMGLGIKTGKPDQKKEYPVLMNYSKMDIKANINGNQTPMPANPLVGAKIYGRYDAAGNFQLDSLPGQNLDDAGKKAIAKMATDLQNQIKFPEAGLAVGETYKQNIPMSMPVAGQNMDMLVKSTYKLIKVVNDLAYFDVAQDLTMDVPAGNTTMKIVGGGNGKIEYSLKNKFISTYDTDIKFTYTMSVTNVNMTGKADMKCKYTVGVNAVK